MSKEEKTTEKKIETPAGKYTFSKGKRKRSIARVRMYKGKGVITVNSQAIDKYITVKDLITTVNEPLVMTGNKGKWDITVKVDGGGITSQAEAIRHGITRGLVEIDEANKPTLKKAGLLTRDSRVKERKKFGLKRARKAPQFSKR
jgi:small subunit ribosomal protein S9